MARTRARSFSDAGGDKPALVAASMVDVKDFGESTLTPRRKCYTQEDPRSRP